MIKKINKDLSNSGNLSNLLNQENVRYIIEVETEDSVIVTIVKEYMEIAAIVEPQLKLMDGMEFIECIKVFKALEANVGNNVGYVKSEIERYIKE